MLNPPAIKIIATVNSEEPNQSTLRLAVPSGISRGTSRITSGITSAIKITLMPNIQRQPKNCTIAPPIRGPNADAPEVTAVQSPISFAIWSCGTDDVNLANAKVPINPEPTPWIARPTMSTPMSGESALTAEPTTKMEAPIMYNRRRPVRSPSAPAGTAKAAPATMYAIIAHCIWAIPMSKSA